MKNTKNKAENQINNHVALIHIGEREKSGVQIETKLKQYDFQVDEIDVEDDFHEFHLEPDIYKAVVVNIGKVSFEYDQLLSDLFEKDLKVIINEASLSNDLIGLKRRSWERHLLNKIDSSISIIPDELFESKVLNVSQYGIEETWILAASIGGPEAIKKFVSSLPADSKKLFILVQHMDKEFVLNFIEQLKSNTNLKVALPISGQKLKPMILIYPTDEQVSLDNKGNIELYAMKEEFKFVPCIDSAVQSLIRRFEKINIAVFSGMCHDGVEAAKIVKKSGGKVVLQSEESCVLSTIIKNIKKELDFDFEGSPKQMAKYINN